jgi:hypothetical protein
MGAGDTAQSVGTMRALLLAGDAEAAEGDSPRVSSVGEAAEALQVEEEEGGAETGERSEMPSEAEVGGPGPDAPQAPTDEAPASGDDDSGSRRSGEGAEDSEAVSESAKAEMAAPPVSVDFELSPGYALRGMTGTVDHGQLTAEWSDIGATFSGKIEHGMPHDPVGAKIVWADGGEYSGAVANGLRHGEGRMTYPSGSSYLGAWREGKRHGTGVYTSLGDDGEPVVTFEGSWVDNVRSGEGFAFYHRSKNSYRGTWLNDQKNGTGRFVWATKREVYSGEWKDNKPHGVGTYFWLEEGDERNDADTGYPDFDETAVRRALRNFYVGSMDRGLRHGHGTFLFADGSCYSGEWKKNMKSGRATFCFASGREVTGEFVDDYMKQSRDLDDQPIWLRIPPEDVVHNNLTPPMKETQLAELRHAILRNRASLHELYSFYATPPEFRDDLNRRPPWILSEMAMSQLLVDADIPTPSVPLGSLIKLLDKVPRSHNGIEISAVRASDGTTSFGGRLVLFWEFCAFLVHVALLRFPSYGVASDSVDQLVRFKLRTLDFADRGALHDLRNSALGNKLDKLLAISDTGSEQTQAPSRTVSEAPTIGVAAERLPESEAIDASNETVENDQQAGQNVAGETGDFASSGDLMSESAPPVPSDPPHHEPDDRGNLYSTELPVDTLWNAETTKLLKGEICPLAHRLLKTFEDRMTLQDLLTVLVHSGVVSDRRVNSTFDITVEKICALYTAEDGEFEVKVPVSLFDIAVTLLSCAVMAPAEGAFGARVAYVVGRVASYSEK